MFFSWIGVRVYMYSEWNINCAQYIRMAGQSKDIKSCLNNLDVAIKYLEVHKMTSGYVTIIATSNEKQNLQLYYQSLYACRQNLKTNPDPTGALQVVKRTIFDAYQNNNNSDVSSYLNCPAGMSVYPYNGWFLLFVLISLLMMIISAFCYYFVDG